MKLMKLNTRGFSHEIVLVLLVVMVGIGGSAYLVLSHADSCTPVSSPMSSPTSSPASSSCPASGATSEPVSVVTSGSCSVGLGDNLKFGQTLQPKFTMYNTGDTSFAPSVKLKFIGISKAGKATTLSSMGMAIVPINPGGSSKATSPLTMRVPHASAGMSKLEFTVTNTTVPKFTCSSTAALPVGSYL